ncbi:MAG: hypothetical protein GY794_16405, partial [bacterium]|nr:hypothetical protein [bacterium]
MISSVTIEVLDGGYLDLSDPTSTAGYFFVNDGVLPVQGDLLDTKLAISAWNPEFHLLGSG